MNVLPLPLSLPQRLLFHIKCFSKNIFVSERNPTIVTFGCSFNLDMSPYVEPNSKLCPGGEPIWYDLIENIAHEAARGREDAEANEKKTRKSQTADKSKADTRLVCRECSEGAAKSR
ncbi:hypothetical protein F5882DRAFT_398025 [Hyaloscypha sp. PMI_1271]|nr:hypothetical protein F5882DRAFT_398025 [Hyaloscypha sp. PMI_1271]